MARWRQEERVFATYIAQDTVPGPVHRILVGFSTMGDWNSSGPASWRKILWLDVDVSQVPIWIDSVMLVDLLLFVDLLSVQLWVAAG